MYKRYMSPTQRSLAYLREQGYRCWITEHWNPWAKKRVDLWNWCDILAIGHGETIGVQTTTKSNLSARIKKYEENEYVPELIKSNWRLHGHGWFKNKEGKWEVKVVELN